MDPSQGVMERNKAVIRRLLAAADRGDLAAVAECYAEEYQDQTRGGSRASSGKSGALDAFAELVRAFPDTRHTIHQLLAESDFVVLRVSASGTHRAEFRGVAATGRQVTQAHTAIYRMRGERIIERWADGASQVADQLHPEPPAGTRPADGGVHVLRGASAVWQPDVSGAEFWSLALDRLSFTSFRLAPGARFPKHSHASEQITMVLSGTLVFELEDGTVALENGDAIAIPAWVEHAVSAGDRAVLAVDAWSPPAAHLAVAR